MSSFGLARITRNVGDRGQFGAIAVHRTALDSDSALAPHMAGGMDASVRFLNDRLFVSSFAAWTAELCTDCWRTKIVYDHSEYIKARYKGKRWQPSASFSESARDLIRKSALYAEPTSPMSAWTLPLSWKEGYWSSMEFAVNGYAVSMLR